MKSILLVMGLSVVSVASVYGSQSEQQKESSPHYSAETLFPDPVLQKKAEALVKESKEQSEMRKKSMEAVRAEKKDPNQLRKAVFSKAASKAKTLPASAPSSVVLEKEEAHDVPAETSEASKAGEEDKEQEEEPDSPLPSKETPKASEEGGRPEHFSSMGWKRY